MADGASVDGGDVDDADCGGAEEPREEQLRAADRPYQERLQEPALRVAAHDAEREKHREDDAEEERCEHRETEQEGAGECALVDRDICRRRDVS